jgi:predicted alpha/beta-fold hydrolase
MDLQQTVTHLERAQPLYHHYVLKGLQDFIRRHGEAWPAATPPEMVARALRTRCISEFDDQIMAPRHGFNGVADYYARTSCGPRLQRARVPCLAIHTDDDPMVPVGTVLPYVDAAASAVTFLRLPHGGHVGFLGSWGWAGWLRSRAMDAVLAWARELLPPPSGNA